MRNLKRILALVMTLALCLGLSSVAFAASYDSFSDADQVTYEEAMDVLVALGVIEGTDNGTLSPAGTLTRETAAKIIAYLSLGGTAAEALSTGTSPFSDVDASRWSAGYIAYCANQGIINGRGDGTFDPTAEVSGYEFAKMLLCAIGYGENGEFTGSYWAINTAAYASQAELFEGGENINYNNAATREEAMLYAFNALTRPMTVKYSDTFSAYYSGTSPLNTIAEEDEYKYTLGYQSYGLYQGDAETDDFGRVGYVWEVDGEAVSDPYYEDAAATFTGYVTSSAIYNALGSKYAGDATLYVDGEQQDDFPIARGDTVDSLGNLSAQVFVYADSDTYDVTIVVINTYVGQVTGVDEDEVTVTVYDSGVTGSELYCGVDVSGTYDYETAAAFDEDEYVLVTVAGGDIQSMESADTIVGTMDASSSSYLIIDGTTYYKSATYGELDDVEDDGDYDSEYTFILDQNGYLLGSELYEEADADHSSYIYVTGSQVSENSLSGTSAQIAVMYLDGTTDILDLYVTESDGDYYYVLNGVKTEITKGDDDALRDLENGGFFRYSENSSGYVSLKALSTSSQKAVGYNSATFEVSSSTRKLTITGDVTSGVEPSKVYLSSSTVLHVIDEDGDVTTVTGYSNIKGYGEEAKPTLVFYSGSVVSDIYTFDGTWASAGNFALYVGQYTTSSDTYYRFYKDGETVTYTADEDLSLTVRSIYNLTVSNGVISDATEMMAYGDAEKVTRTRTDYFTTAESGAHYYDDDVVVYDFTNGNAAATLSSGDYVVYAEEDGMVAAVYIVTDPSTTGDKDEDSADVEISSVKINKKGNVVFTADTEGATVYVVVEGKYAYTGWVEEDTVEVTTADGSNTVSFGLPEGTYRVTIYADEEQSERLFRGTFVFDGSTATDPQG